MNARRLRAQACRFETSGARFERPTMKETFQLLTVFIMVCSWEPIKVAVDRLMEKSTKLLLLVVTAGNSFNSTVPLMGLLLSCPANSSSSVRVDVVILKAGTVFFSTGDFRNFVWILPERVVVALLRWLRRSRRGAVLFCVLWLWRYLSV